jgi:hypothetical protein
MEEPLALVPQQDAEWRQQHQAAVDALTKLVMTTLTSDKRDRFERAQRLSKIAHALQRESATRVGDLTNADQDEDGNYMVGGGGIMLPPRIRPLPAPNDGVQMQRDIAMLLQRQTDNHAVSQAARAAESEALELSSLLDSLDRMTKKRLDTAAVKARIAQLNKSMEARTNGAAASEVVHPDVARRHPAGDQGTDVHQAQLPPADADRGGGDGGLAQARDAGAAAQTLVRACRVPY